MPSQPPHALRESRIHLPVLSSRRTLPNGSTAYEYSLPATSSSSLQPVALRWPVRTTPSSSTSTWPALTTGPRSPPSGVVIRPAPICVRRRRIWHLSLLEKPLSAHRASRTLPLSPILLEPRSQPKVITQVCWFLRRPVLSCLKALCACVCVAWSKQAHLRLFLSRAARSPGRC